MYSDLKSVASALNSGAIDRVSPPLDQSSLDHAILAVESLIKGPLPAAYKQFLILTAGSGLIEPNSGLYIYSVEQVASSLAQGHTLLLRSATKPERKGIIIGQRNKQVLVLRSTSVPMDPLLSFASWPEAFTPPPPPMESSGTTGIIPNLLSPLFESLERSWHEDNSWTHVGWGI